MADVSRPEANPIRLGVFRRLDNRLEGLDDQSSRGIELHERRKLALHAVLDGDTIWEVKNWGDTDTEESHEYVDLLLALKALGHLLAPAAIQALTFVGGISVKSLVETPISEGVKWLIAKLWNKQVDKQILDYTFTLPGGQMIRVDPPDQGGQLTVSWTNGKVTSIHYDATQEDVNKLGANSTSLSPSEK